MFDDSGFGGESMFDANHDGHLDAFERDSAECFLHDCDTFDQVMKKERLSSGGATSKKGSSIAEDFAHLFELLSIIAILATIIMLIVD